MISKEYKPEKAPQKVSESLISQTTILSMGFTKSMIDKLLPAPILKQNPRYKAAAPMKLWKEADVLAVMETAAFQEAAAEAGSRKSRGYKAQKRRGAGRRSDCKHPCAADRHASAARIDNNCKAEMV